jgi:hypothetical protein
VVGAVAALFGVFGPTGCGRAELDRTETLRRGITAYCTAQVEGIGQVDTETDYLPHVVACENGAAPYEALKAQAVAARTFLYYKMDTWGQIGDGTHDQVYSCANQPQQVHYDAVAETAGQVLRYNDVTICSFYVAGAIPQPPGCVATASDPDPHSTEWAVTYNEGLAGDDINQSPLGFVDPSNYLNRGCMSQNGASCLHDAGYGYQDILRFYYGADIVLETAQGECVGPVEPCHVIQPEETILEEDGPCFDARGPVDYWHHEPVGHGDHCVWTYTIDEPTATNFAQWRLHFAAAGDYELSVYIPADFGESVQAPYLIVHGGEESTAVTSQADHSGGWAVLGTFAFAEGGEQLVELGDNTGEPYVSGQDNTEIVFDALRIVPIDVDGPDGGVGDDGGMEGDAGQTGDGGEEGDGGQTPGSGSGGGGCGCVVAARKGSAPTTPPPFFAFLLSAIALLGFAASRSERRRKRSIRSIRSIRSRRRVEPE